MTRPRSTPLTNPSIDTFIANQLEADLSDAIEHLIHTSITNSLRTLKNPRHAAVFAAHHGIDHEGNPCQQTATFEEIANLFGCSRQRAGEMYRRAATPIYAQLSRDLIRALRVVTR